VKNAQNKKANWTICPECKGRGKKSQKLKKKVRLNFQRELEEFEKSDKLGKNPVRPKAHLSSCLNCSGSGLIQSNNPPISDSENYSFNFS